jgi:uncharacterized metal-binding protein YceD (DUF177 family)
MLRCNFSADYVQRCVVSLKPLKKNIDCSFERIYSSKVVKYDDYIVEPQEEYIRDLNNSQDPPDLLIDGCFNLGECVAEQLAIEIEPYPRFEGIDFAGFSSSQGEQSSIKNAGPFAVLEQLKKKP